MLYGETGLCLGAWRALLAVSACVVGGVVVPAPGLRALFAFRFRVGSVVAPAPRRWGDKIHLGGASFKGPRRAWAKGPLYNRVINFILLKEIYPIEE